MTIDRRRYRRVVVLTGAGVSAGSGLSTFRGENGVWEEHDVARLGHVSALRQCPEEAWRLFNDLRGPIARAQPNPAHHALARWEAERPPGDSFLVVTQNVDGLHQRAGSKSVAEIHGNILFTRCSQPACELPRYRDELIHASGVPACPRCGAILRPDIVLFGEDLPAEETRAVWHALERCDLFVAIGTSGVVAPAAYFVEAAAAAGARTVLINLEPLEEPNPAFQEEYLGRAEELVPRLLGIGE